MNSGGTETALPDAAPHPKGGGAAFFRRLRTGDAIARAIVQCAAGAVLLITVVIAFELYSQSGLARARFGWRFIVTSTWDPVAGEFGALPFIYGTVITSVLAMVLAVPQGIGAAIFSPRWRLAAFRMS